MNPLDANTWTALPEWGRVFIPVLIFCLLFGFLVVKPWIKAPYRCDTCGTYYFKACPNKCPGSLGAPPSADAGQVVNPCCARCDRPSICAIVKPGTRPCDHPATGKMDPSFDKGAPFWHTFKQCPHIEPGHRVWNPSDGQKYGQGNWCRWCLDKMKPIGPSAPL